MKNTNYLFLAIAILFPGGADARWQPGKRLAKLISRSNHSAPVERKAVRPVKPASPLAGVQPAPSPTLPVPLAAIATKLVSESPEVATETCSPDGPKPQGAKNPDATYGRWVGSFYHYLAADGEWYVADKASVLETDLDFTETAESKEVRHAKAGDVFFEVGDTKHYSNASAVDNGLALADLDTETLKDSLADGAVDGRFVLNQFQYRGDDGAWHLPTSSYEAQSDEPFLKNAESSEIRHPKKGDIIFSIGKDYYFTNRRVIDERKAKEGTGKRGLNAAGSLVASRARDEIGYWIQGNKPTQSTCNGVVWRYGGGAFNRGILVGTIEQGKPIDIKVKPGQFLLITSGSVITNESTPGWGISGPPEGHIGLITEIYPDGTVGFTHQNPKLLNTVKTDLSRVKGKIEIWQPIHVYTGSSGTILTQPANRTM